MNYVKLNIGGKERGAKLGLGFLQFFTESEKITLPEVFAKFEGMNAILFMPLVMYYAMAYNCKRAGEPADFTREDVMDWIDEAGGVSSPELVKFSNAFAESLGADLGKTTPQNVEATLKEEKEKMLKK